MVIELQFEDPSNEKQSVDKTSEQEAVLETSGVETEGLGMSSMIITYNLDKFTKVTQQTGPLSTYIIIKASATVNTIILLHKHININRVIL